MSLEDIDDYCDEVLHFSWLLDELHHYSKYDLESVRLHYHTALINLRDELVRVTNEKWFINQTKSDELIVGEK